MKRNYEIACAMIAGFVFYAVGCPILETLGNLINTKITKIINKDQITMRLDSVEGQAAEDVIHPNINNTAAIGFHAPSEIDNEEAEYGKRQRHK